MLGSTVAVLDDLAPGATATVDETVTQVPFGQPLSDRVVGSSFFADPKDATADTMNRYIRHTMVDQLTFDPNLGTTNQLPADGAVILGWGRGSIAARRDRRPDTASDRQRPVLPADGCRGPRQDHVPR